MVDAEKYITKCEKYDYNLGCGTGEIKTTPKVSLPEVKVERKYVPTSTIKSVNVHELRKELKLELPDDLKLDLPKSVPTKEEKMTEMVSKMRKKLIDVCGIDIERDAVNSMDGDEVYKLYQLQFGAVKGKS
jgi:hypothetical protein